MSSANVERAFFAAEPSADAALAYALDTASHQDVTPADYAAAHRAASSDDSDTRADWAYAGLKTTELLQERLSVEDDPFILGELIERCTHTGLLTPQHFEHAMIVGGRALMHAAHCPSAPPSVRAAFREQLHGWRADPTRPVYRPVNPTYGAALTARYDPAAIPLLITDAPSDVLVELRPIMRYVDALTRNPERRADLARATAARLTDSTNDGPLAETLVRFASLLAARGPRRLKAAFSTVDLLALPARAFGQDSGDRYSISPLIEALLPTDTARQVFNHVANSARDSALTLEQALTALRHADTPPRTR